VIRKTLKKIVALDGYIKKKPLQKC